MVLLLNFPFQQFCWFLLIFGMLKAAEKLRNPFGCSMLSAKNHQQDYCLDMFEELEVEIWKASKFIENQDEFPFFCSASAYNVRDTMMLIYEN